MIRYAEISDLKKIQELNLALFKKEYNEYDQTFDLDWTMGDLGKDYFLSSTESDSACTLVAEVENQVVGYLVGWIKKKRNPCRTIKQQAELENMFVEKHFRGQGLGSQLVKEFLIWATKQGVDNVCVTASSKNQNAIEFYKKQGFGDYEVTLEISLR